MRNGYRRIGRGRILGAVTLLGVCLALGVKYGIQHGWLAGHTHWLTQRHRPSERPPGSSYI
jgi:hypothetical protein